MFKKILIIISLFLLTGCYDHKELNTIAILTATEINKVDDEFIVSAQVVNPQSPDKTISVQAPFIIYEGKGKTIQEAYRQIKLQSSRFLYPSHMEIIIVNEKIAKEDISQIIDFYQRNHAFRTEFNILIGKNDNILNITTPIDPVSSASISESLETSNKFLGVTNPVTFNEFTNMSLDPNLEIILPSIEAIKEDEKTKDTNENTESTKVKNMYKLQSLAVFKENKLQGYLTEDESITYNLIKNNVKNTIITYECEKNKYTTLEIVTSEAKITTKNQEININLSLSGNINEYACSSNLEETKNLKELEKNMEKYLKDTTINNINNVRKKYNTDVFGFLDLIYKHDYETYKKIKDTWYESTFKNIKINVKTNIDITGKGNILEGINEKN